MEDVSNVHISVVTPVYGCCQSLEKLYEQLEKVLSIITDKFEIIMVNDASPDNAWEVIKELSLKDSRVMGINLSRNFGQHRAITAGLDYASGDWVMVMDCDLQDKPEEIIKLYRKAQEGYDVVFGRRTMRQDKFLKKLGSKVFHKVYDYFTEAKMDSSTANFSIISQKVVKELRKFREQNRSYPLFVNLVGFKRINIDIEHSKREIGESTYSFKKLMNLAIDSIVSQSNKPLRLSIKFGFILSFFSIFYGVWLILRYFIQEIPVAGWTSVMVSIFFIGGLLFANLGFLGLYIGKVFNETKGRPLYTIQNTTFDKD